MMRISGRAPLEKLRAYAPEVVSYTHGQGRLTWEPDGFAPCQEQEKRVAESGYDPLRDPGHSPDSVFCSHGAGTAVPWNEVERQMHLSLSGERQEASPYRAGPVSLDLADRELQAIFAREFGPERRPVWQPPRATWEEEKPAPAPPAKKQFLIVDGYNVLFQWEELRRLAKEDLDAARGRLIEQLGNYSAYRRCETAVVFDAYRVAGHRGERFDAAGIHVVYTAEGETGDLYIEKLVNEIGRNYTVRVVTSDGLIRLSAMRSGVLRVGAAEFGLEMAETEAAIRGDLETLEQKNRLATKRGLEIPEN